MDGSSGNIQFTSCVVYNTNKVGVGSATPNPVTATSGSTFSFSSCYFSLFRTNNAPLSILENSSRVSKLNSVLGRRGYLLLLIVRFLDLMLVIFLAILPQHLAEMYFILIQGAQ